MSARVCEKGGYRMLEFLHSYQSGPDTSHGGLIPKSDCSKSFEFFVEKYRTVCQLLKATFCDPGESAGNHAARWPRFDHPRALFPTQRASSMLFGINGMMASLQKRCSLKHLSREVATSLFLHRRLFIFRSEEWGSITIMAVAAFVCEFNW